ncbi:cation:proton antiporter family protein [Ornithinimicrobium tianjinense]|uniref:Potassium transporter Kef n=1 Tax=Ornithinimicrobium tianjinense TaxID=1195761 RepID=A0A917BWE2_9MICO|nr:cation:proton antiporter family protein [Ornithinimicrobium tianjinense]GGF59480.1 potassium transporter Kef [Ornithinimicrobium tianjinense]
MTDIAFFLAATFAAGLVMSLVRLPALLGFLAAGFLLNGLGVEELPYLDFVAELGVALLLFGIGLKLDVRSLLAREVWITTGGHLALSVAVGTGFLWVLGLLGFPLLQGLDVRTLAMVAFALAFSSTVFVIKVLEEQSELQSFYGRVAIAILVMQDLAAVIFMTVVGGELPSPWAILLAVGLAPLGWVARRLWDHVPHGDMQALFGLAMALGPGYAAFEAVGLKGDLGALMMGMILAGDKAATQLSHHLFLLKDLLLVGFFISIGFGGRVEGAAVSVGLVLLLLLPVQVLTYIWLLDSHKLRRRTSVKAGLVLGNYSEFGLIVVSVAVTQGLLDEIWLVVMSVSVASSFVVASVVNTYSDQLLGLARRIMPMHPPTDVHPHEKPISFGNARAVVMGMGRIGRSAYTELAATYGLDVLGVENLPSRVQELTEAGLSIVEADAADGDFWSRLESTRQVEIVVLAMPFHGASRLALAELSKIGYTGVVAAVAQYDDDAAEYHELGADVVVHLYEGAGASIAEQAAEALADRS